MREKVNGSCWRVKLIGGYVFLDCSTDDTLFWVERKYLEVSS